MNEIKSRLENERNNLAQAMANYNNAQNQEIKMQYAMHVQIRQSEVSAIEFELEELIYNMKEGKQNE